MDHVTHPIPKPGHHRLIDILSEHTSKETKLSACRWFVEMMIDVFFKQLITSSSSIKAYERMSLVNKIKSIRESGMHYGAIHIRMDEIRVAGNKGAHYNKRNIDDDEVKDIVRKCLELFDLLLIDWFQKNKFNKTENTATIFSTLMPAVRVRVLKNFSKIGEINDNYDKALFHKLLLALVKNDQKSEAIKFLNSAKKQGELDESEFYFELNSISIIDEKRNNELPVAKNLNDSKRNFEKVMSRLDPADKRENKGLIEIIERLHDQINPSELGDSLGFQKYAAGYFVSYI